MPRPVVLYRSGDPLQTCLGTVPVIQGKRSTYPLQRTLWPWVLTCRVPDADVPYTEFATLFERFDNVRKMTVTKQVTKQEGDVVDVWIETKEVFGFSSAPNPECKPSPTPLAGEAPGRDAPPLVSDRAVVNVEEMRKRGFKFPNMGVIPNKGQGNCLYHAIFDAANVRASYPFVDDPSRLVRDALVQHLRGISYTDNVMQYNHQELISSVETDGAWGNDAVLGHLATMYSRCIFVYVDAEKNWQVFVPGLLPLSMDVCKGHSLFLKLTGGSMGLTTGIHFEAYAEQPE